MPAQALSGRDRELRILNDLIGGVQERGVAIVVLGEPGIGKSALLAAAAEYGRAASLQVLVTTGVEAEAQLPFAGLHQLLRPVLSAVGGLPETQRRALSAGFGADDGQPPEPFMIALAALNLLANLAADGPLLPIADDMQWLDRPSQDVLTFIARRVSADPIVLVGSVRKGHDIAFATVGLPELDIHGLDDASARAVLAEHAGDLSYESRERILREALGNPLALVELPAALRAAPDRGLEMLPLTARLTVARRYAANAALAEVLTDHPYRRTWHRAQSITGPDDAVADELEESYGISLRRGSATGAIWALERSAQLTTDSARRGRRLLLAAEHAFGLGRADLVDQLLTRAAHTNLSRLDRARMEWLREIFNDGVPGDAGRVLELCDIARESIEAKDSGLALNLLLGAALRCWWADAGPAARARVIEVAGLLTEKAGDDPRYVATLGVAEPVLQGAPVTKLLSQVVTESVTDADALRLLGMAAHAIGDPVRAADFLDRSEAKLREQGQLGLLPHVRGMQSPVYIELGDWARAGEAAEECRRFAQETGQPICSDSQLVNEARSAALRGDSEHALQLAAQGEYR